MNPSYCVTEVRMLKNANLGIFDMGCLARINWSGLIIRIDYQDCLTKRMAISGSAMMAIVALIGR